MNPRPRSEPVFKDIAFSMAALPARISSGVGGVQMGCHHVIAIPHLRHRAFRVALGHRGKNPSRLFVEKRVKQCYATSEIRLDVRRTRYRKRNISDAAQIPRFWSGGGLSIAQDEQSTGKCDDTKGA